MQDRKYRSANYQFSPEWKMESTFIANVLKKRYRIDRMILIGTVKSMWENVYEAFAEHPDEEVTRKLQEVCVNANSGSPLELPHLQELEAALGKGSKVLLIKYGLTQEEIEYNNELILGLEHYLHDGDELYVDITHSFRSLPMMLMNTLIYLKTVSRKRISIKHIAYGMYEATGELGYTPVVELDSLLDTMDWITGAYSFMQFGDAYKIAERLKAEDYATLAQQLTAFSDVKNLGLLKAFEKQAKSLNQIEEDMPPMARLIVPEVVNHFLSYFKDADGNTAKFQYKLACWYLEKHNYSSAYLAVVEAMVSHVAIKKGLDPESYIDRDEAKNAIHNDSAFRDLKRIYGPLNQVRVEIAHGKLGKDDYRQCIQNLKTNLPKLESIIMKGGRYVH
jgi:CRISPR-associated Csx2 family protein